jgi:hypothetical protein
MVAALMLPVFALEKFKIDFKSCAKHMAGTKSAPKHRCRVHVREADFFRQQVWP